jgi:HTH-type transcriptional regulator/antitoxin HipB
MSDLQKYIKNRKKNDPIFAEDFDSGYEHFKIGVLLKQAREESGHARRTGLSCKHKKP